MTILRSHVELFVRRNWRSLYGRRVDALRADLDKLVFQPLVMTETQVRRILMTEDIFKELLSRIRTHPKYIALSIAAGVNLPTLPPPIPFFTSAPIF